MAVHRTASRLLRAYFRRQIYQTPNGDGRLNPPRVEYHVVRTFNPRRFHSRGDRPNYIEWIARYHPSIATG